MSHDEESVLEADPLLAQTPAVSRMERLLYYLIWIWRICIFAVTGSSSMAVTRAILTRALQMESGRRVDRSCLNEGSKESVTYRDVVLLCGFLLSGTSRIHNHAYLDWHLPWSMEVLLQHRFSHVGMDVSTADMQML